MSRHSTAHGRSEANTNGHRVCAEPSCPADHRTRNPACPETSGPIAEISLTRNKPKSVVRLMQKGVEGNCTSTPNDCNIRLNERNSGVDVPGTRLVTRGMSTSRVIASKHNETHDYMCTTQELPSVSSGISSKGVPATSMRDLPSNILSTEASTEHCRCQHSSASRPPDLSSSTNHTLRSTGTRESERTHLQLISINRQQGSETGSDGQVCKGVREGGNLLQNSLTRQDACECNTEHFYSCFDPHVPHMMLRKHLRQ
jgi:hypothetical protein